VVFVSGSEGYDLNMDRTIDPVRILAIDVGAGTQDILVYDSRGRIENCAKLVLPSQTQVVAREIRRATRKGLPIYLAGQVMGGGASSAAIEEHLRAGLAVSASPTAARSIHNDLERVQRMGITIASSPSPGSQIIWMRDVDISALRALFENFAVTAPSMFAIAVQDHGYLPGAGGREFRYEFLQSMLMDGGDLLNMIYRDPPDYMIRMRAIVDALPGAVVMDTGSAAVLGALGDRLVARHAATDGVVVVNIGNMHTFGIAMRGRRVFGLFEHHTGGITPDVLQRLVERLQAGSLTHEEVVARGGHGAAFGPDYPASAPFGFVAITGPNRYLAEPLGYHAAVPHGDMMLAGPFGLVEGTLQLLAAEGYDQPVRTIMAS
jgi:uncharacterized protein (DUF1786 family)